MQEGASVDRFAARSRTRPLDAARIAEELGAFDIGRVIEGARDKIVRRHPHVFGDAKASTTEEVLAHWKRVKAEERKARENEP